MRFHRFLAKSLVVCASLAALALILAPTISFAATGTDTFGLNPVNSEIALGNSDLRVTVAKFIQVGLSVLGVIALGIVLYGGFVYMTAGGNEDKVATARKILVNGVIGLVIILSSWGITTFVLKKLSEATGSGTVDLSSGGPVPGSACDPSSPNYNPSQCSNFCSLNPTYSACVDAAFYVKSITPSTIDASDKTGMNAPRIRVLFSHSLASNTNIAQAVRLNKKGGAVVESRNELVENGRVLELHIQPELPPGTIEPGDYTITVSPDIKDTNNGALEANYRAGNITYPLTADFSVDRAFYDEAAPRLESVTLNGAGGTDLPIYIGQTATFNVTVRDRGQTPPYGGTGLVKIAIAEVGSNQVISETYQAPAQRVGSSPDFVATYKTAIDATKFSALKQYRATFTGTDIATNKTTATLTFRVYAASCNNGVQDGDETSVDAGGSCGVGPGGSCTADNQCAPGNKCIDNKCSAAPQIRAVDPMDGAEGSWITVSGVGFGTVPGKVEFLVNNAWKEAGIVACTGGVLSWSPTWAVIKVPDGIAATNAIRLTTGAAGSAPQSDRSDDEYGPKPGGDGLFRKSNVTRPALCGVSVTDNATITVGSNSIQVIKGARKAPVTTPVTIGGTNLGSNGTIAFGPASAQGTNWIDVSINTRVPLNLQPGVVPVSVTVDGKTSNAVPFTVQSATDGQQNPVISAIDPASVTPRSYITIKGSGFSTQGTVFIASSAEKVQTCITQGSDPSCRSLNVSTFPAACGTTWNPNQVIAEIPDGTPAGDYFVLLRNGDQQRTDGQARLQIVNGAPLPSICAINPAQGPAPLGKESTGLRLVGVNFSDTPVVYFWQKNSSATDLNTWLHSDVHTLNGTSVIKSSNDGEINTLIPVTGSGQTMTSGPIKVRSKTSAFSNGVTYTVNDCRQSPGITGYQCCTVGPDAGVFKPSNMQCSGETREAGYVWRFTTGLIPELPRVAEQCNEVNWNSPGAAIDFPSPTPWEKTTRGRSACTNASIAVKFTSPMDASTISPTSVKVLKCAQASNGNPDCSKATEDTDLVLGLQNQLDSAVLIIRTSGQGLMQANTWYRVQLSDKIQSLQYKQVLNETKAQRFPLQKTRPCGDGTAYCFDFKTSDNTCKLSGANILPITNTVNYLGMLQSPSFPFEANGDPMAPTHPLYYYLWGKTDQECSVMSADGMGWKWAAEPTAKAGVIMAPGVEYGLTYTDSRAKVIAKEQTVPDKAIISATSQSNKAGANNGFIDIWAAFNAKKDYSVVGSTGVSLATTQLPLLNFNQPFTLELNYRIVDAKLGKPDALIKNLLRKKNAYAFYYTAGSSAETFGLCLGLLSGDTIGDNVCSRMHVPSVTGEQRSVLTYDGKTIVWYRADGSVAATKDMVFPQSLDFLKITTDAQKDVQHVWNTFAIKAGAMSDTQVRDYLGLNAEANYVATSSLFINLLDPAVVEAGPSCAESCVNTNLWATFNRQMATSTFGATNAWIVKECVASADGACNDSSAVTITDWFAVDTDVSTPSHLELMLRQGRLLKPNTYYKVTLGGGIKALDALQPPKLGKSLAEYTWTFRTQNNPAPCAPGSVRVTPQPFTATAVGQRTIYTAQPYSSPNACSQTGQPLSKWAYGYEWKTLDTQVASVSNVTTGYGVKPFCSLTCLPTGSTTNKKDQALCGNAKIDTGEDCDIADEGSKAQCALNCVYNEAKRKTLGHTGSAPIAAFDSSKPGQSYCGDGQVTKGETCDIKNDAGCTSQCLRAGTSLAATWCAAHTNDSAETKATCLNSIAVCGNNVIENGEMCEPGLNGADSKTCNPNTCLWQNTCGTPVQQCDPKTQEGCTSSCTLAGSSPAYSAKSLCGDGKVGTGEFQGCENVTNGTGLAAGPTQIVEAVGQGTVSASSTFQETDVEAKLLVTTTVKGVGDYRLQCGYQEFLAPVSGMFNDCPQNGSAESNEYGVNSGSCCALRAKRSSEYPLDGTGLANSEPACRNTYIEAVFPRRIRQDSLKDNVVLVRGYTNDTTTCPQGTLNVTSDMQRFVATSAGDTPPVGFWEGLWKNIKSFFHNLFGRDGAVATDYKNTISGFSLWCTAGVALSPTTAYAGAGANATSTVSLAIDKALDANATYGVWVRGGKNGVADSTGVSVGSPDSHPATPDDIWFFRTGAELCRLSEVAVLPTSHTFSRPNTSTAFIAIGRTPNNQQIVPTPAYDWVWSWKPIGTPVFDIPDVTTQDNSISSKDVQGQITAVAQASVTRDLSETNNQQGQVFGAPFELVAFFCERPWPAAGSNPFRDKDFNFAMMYCADAGKTGVDTDDLPYFNAPSVYTATSTPPVPLDTLKKYLFFNNQNDDVIGIQVFRNDADANGAVKSLTQWYQEKFQSLGSMKPVTVSGYEALSDGTNYYISALNYTGANVYQNIYLFSINANPQVASRTVFEKLLASLRFNTNLTDYGYCLSDKAGLSVRSADVNKITSVPCTTDLQCVTATGQAMSGTNGICSNAKTKFFRDWQRLHDVQLAQDSLDAYYATVDKVLNFKADLKSGTFIPGYTSSRWPSWGTLGGLVGGLPVDPINNWVGCDSTDGQTCWNATTNEFSCPKVSRVYEYEYVSSTGKYLFHAPLEFFNTSDTATNQFIDVSKFSSSPWQQCVNNAKVSPFSAKCGDGAVGPGEQCDPPGTSVVVSCSPNETKTRTCSASCQWTDSACVAAGQCGNGKVEGGEKCDEGSVNGQDGHCNKQCSGYSAIACGNGTLEKPAEYCEKVPDVHVAASFDGSKYRFKYGTDSSISNINNFLVLKGNPDVLRIVAANKYCSKDSTLLCETNSDCVAPQSSQLWDLGTNLSDAVVYAPTDLGSCVAKPGLIGTSYNLNKDFSCAYDCKATGGFCGDKLVQTESGEQCDDGNTADDDNCSSLCQREDAKMCALGKPKTVAGTAVKPGATKETPYVDVFVMENSQPVNASCVGTSAIPDDICRAMKVKIPGAVFDESNCLRIDVESKNGTMISSCTGSQDSKTMAQHFAEQKSALGSLFTGLRVRCDGAISSESSSAPVGQCGNSKKDVGEACDLGSANGKPCTPGYGVSCQYCSNDCKNVLTVDTANFCGNSKIDEGSPEVCETVGGVAKVPFASLNGTVDLRTKSCESTQRGAYQCSTDCRVLTDSCVSCGKFEGKPVPRISVVNPMVGPDASWPFTKDNYDKEGFMVSTFASVGSQKYKYLGYSKIHDFVRVSTGPATFTVEGGKTPLLYKSLWYDNLERADLINGLETNPQCTADYNLFFNHRGLKNATSPFGNWAGDGSLETDLTNHPEMGDVFSFPVSGQVGQVDTQLIYSPAVPPNTYRVVIRWTEAEQKAGLSFAGGVYNANTATNNFYLDSYNQNGNNVWCNAMNTTTISGAPYWWPTGMGKSSCNPVSGVYMHQATGLDKTFVQAMTINTAQLGSSNSHKAVAFYVKGLQQTIANAATRNITVEVYNYHDGQSSLYSVYKPMPLPPYDNQNPKFAFTIKGAGGSSANPLAPYWHVFNFVYQGNGQYKIAPVGNGNGSIETDLCRVKANMPGVAPCEVTN